MSSRTIRPGHTLGRRARLSWGTAGVALLTAVSSALINELHNGWAWIIAAVIIVLISALVAGWVARTPPPTNENKSHPMRVQDISDAEVAGGVHQQISTAKAGAGGAPVSHHQQVRRVNVSGSIRQSQEDI